MQKQKNDQARLAPATNSRRDFLKKALFFGGAAAFNAAVLADRLKTADTVVEKLVIKNVEEIQKCGYLDFTSNLSIKKVSLEYGNKKATLHLFGATHFESHQESNAKTIVEFMSKSGSSILCTEWPCGISPQAQNHYFGHIAKKAMESGKEVAVIEGYKPDILNYASALPLDLAFVEMITKNKKTGRRSALKLAIWTFFMYLNTSMGRIIPMFAFPITLLGRIPGIDWADPIIDMQRHRFYAASIRKAISEDYMNLTVLTGRAHVEGIVQRIGDGAPEASCFNDYFTIINPEGKLREIKVG